MNLKRNWKPIINKFQAILSKWKPKNLSFGGRLTLIKAVLGNLPTYYLSLFKAPKGEIDTLEKIRRNFIWSREYSKKSICWVNWENIISPPKKVGGIGLGSIKAINLSLVTKWLWKLKNDNSALRAKVINCLHGLSGRHWTVFGNYTIIEVWKNIIESSRSLAKLNIEPNEAVSWNPEEKKWVSDFLFGVDSFLVCYETESSWRVIL